MKFSTLFLFNIDDFISISNWFIAFSFFIMAFLMMKTYFRRQDPFLRRILLAFSIALVVYGIYMILESIVASFQIEISLMPIRALSGAVGIIAVMVMVFNFRGFLKLPAPTTLLQEIENHKATQNELKQSILNFRMVMHNAPIAKALVGLNGNWIFVNKAVSEMLGYSEEELLKTDFQTITHHEDLQKDLDLVNKLLAGAIDSYQLEKRYLHKDGKIIWGLLEVSLVRNVEGIPQHFISQIVDITKIKEAEKEIIRLNQNLESKVKQRTFELESTNEDLENFVFTITHDLRVPLINLRSLVETLEEELGESLEGEHRYMMDLILKNVKRMDSTLLDLLAFSKAAKTELTLSKFDLKAQMTLSFEEMRTYYPNHKIKFDINDDFPFVFGDSRALQQVCQNLISNALKYSSKKETIEIDVRGWRENGDNYFSIKDNGAGFDEKYSDKLFTLFKRLHKSSDFEGTGLGLAISQKIIRKHGGKIWAKSRVGEGATFYFSLPNPILQ